MINRRNFLKLTGMGTLGLIMQDKIPSPEYYNIFHKPLKWKYAAEGLKFSRTEIYRDNKLIDIISSVKINPELNKIRVFSGYNKSGTEKHYIESWQEMTGALAMINSNQFMSNPYLCPCALVICDGEQKGPKYNKYSRGMFLAEPKDLTSKLKKADLLDFDYDKFDYKTTPYTQGVQHWPILLDRNGNIKTKPTTWQANRTLVAKTNDDSILFLTTEGGYFTLYNLGRFLKESNQREDKGFNVNTAMNMDGGYEAEMIVKTPYISYLNYGEFEKQGEGKDLSVLDTQIPIPGVIGVFPRD